MNSHLQYRVYCRQATFTAISTAATVPSACATVRKGRAYIYKQLNAFGAFARSGLIALIHRLRHDRMIKKQGGLPVF